MTERGPAGRLEGGVHVMPVRVYWEDTDGLGIVYYANYLRFIERARSDLLRFAGIDQQAMWRDQGIAFAVRDCHVEYLKPARLDDDLEVHSRLTEVRGVTMLAAQTVRRGSSELARARLRLACIDGAGRPRRLPPALARALATFSPSFTRSSAQSRLGESDHGQ